MRDAFLTKGDSSDKISAASVNSEAKDTDGLIMSPKAYEMEGGPHGVPSDVGADGSIWGAQLFDPIISVILLTIFIRRGDMLAGAAGAPRPEKFTADDLNMLAAVSSVAATILSCCCSGSEELTIKLFVPKVRKFGVK